MAANPCPLSRDQAMDLYFMEHRAKLIDLAAFLDRIDRSTSATPTSDFRLTAFMQAVGILTDGKSERAKRVLELFSDPTTEPIPKASMKGALGAFQKS